MPERPTHYRVLHITLDASAAQIAEAHLVRAAAARNSSEEDRAAVAVAYATLRDPGRRARYDLWLERRGIRVPRSHPPDFHQGSGMAPRHLSREVAALEKASDDLRRNFQLGSFVRASLIPNKPERFFMIVDVDDVLFLELARNGEVRKADPRAIVPRPDREGPSTPANVRLRAISYALHVLFGPWPVRRVQVQPDPSTVAWSQALRELRRGGPLKHLWLSRRWQ